MGDNLYASSEEPDYGDVVGEWYIQDPDYNHTYYPEESCLRYTQVRLASSKIEDWKCNTKIFSCEGLLSNVVNQ